MSGACETVLALKFSGSPSRDLRLRLRTRAFPPREPQSGQRLVELLAHARLGAIDAVDLGERSASGDGRGDLFSDIGERHWGGFAGLHFLTTSNVPSLLSTRSSLHSLFSVDGFGRLAGLSASVPAVPPAEPSEVVSSPLT